MSSTRGEIKRDGCLELSRSEEDIALLESKAAGRISSAFSLMKLRIRGKSRCSNDVRHLCLSGHIEIVSCRQSYEFIFPRNPFSPMIGLHFLLPLIASKVFSSFGSLQHFELRYKPEIVRCVYFHDLGFWSLPISYLDYSFPPLSTLESFKDYILVTDWASFLAFALSVVCEAFGVAVIA